MNDNWIKWLPVLGVIGFAFYQFGDSSSGDAQRLEDRAREMQEEADRLKKMAEKRRQAEQAKQQYKQLAQEAKEV